MRYTHQSHLPGNCCCGKQSFGAEGVGGGNSLILEVKGVGESISVVVGRVGND